MQPVESKFRLFPFTRTFSSLVLPLAALLFMEYLKYTDWLTPVNKISVPAYQKIVGICYFVFAAFWFFSDLKRYIRVEVSDYSIKRKKFYGLGDMQEWPIRELDGFTLEKTTVKGHGRVEEIWIRQGGKKVIVIMEPVFRNYTEIKSAVTAQLKNLSA